MTKTTMSKNTRKVLQKRLEKVTRQLKEQRKRAKRAKVLKSKQYTWQELDSMSAEELFQLIGKPAREEGVRFIPAGWDFGVDDEDRVEDTYNDEQVTSEWFEERCANCGQDRDDEDLYDPEKNNLVLRSCFYCRN